MNMPHFHHFSRRQRLIDAGAALFCLVGPHEEKEL